VQATSDPVILSQVQAVRVVALNFAFRPADNSGKLQVQSVAGFVKLMSSPTATVDFDVIPMTPLNALATSQTAGPAVNQLISGSMASITPYDYLAGTVGGGSLISQVEGAVNLVVANSDGAAAHSFNVFGSFVVEYIPVLHLTGERNA
jgi:hypothetical protein